MTLLPAATLVLLAIIFPSHHVFMEEREGNNENTNTLPDVENDEESKNDTHLVGKLNQTILSITGFHTPTATPSQSGSLPKWLPISWALLQKFHHQERSNALHAGCHTILCKMMDQL